MEASWPMLSPGASEPCACFSLPVFRKPRCLPDEAFRERGDSSGPLVSRLELCGEVAQLDAGLGLGV